MELSFGPTASRLFAAGWAGYAVWNLYQGDPSTALVAAVLSASSHLSVLVDVLVSQRSR